MTDNNIGVSVNGIGVISFGESPLLSMTNDLHGVFSNPATPLPSNLGVHVSDIRPNWTDCMT